MIGTHLCDEDLIRRLPLPLAQLYRRAHNARSALERHHAAYFLWEAGLKLLGSMVVVEYAALGERDDQVTARLQNLARPSVGHWREFVRLLLPVLAQKGDSRFAALPFVNDRARDDLPRAAGLDAALEGALGGRGGARSTVRLRDLFDRLVQYRNREIGHGATGQQPPDFYERMGETLLAGVAELLGKVDVLAGRRLVHISGVRRAASGGWLIEADELTGENARRVAPQQFLDTKAACLPLPERIYLGGSDTGLADMELTPAIIGALRPLHPLLVYESQADEVFFLNARRGRQRTEYLCYSSGRVSDRQDQDNERQEFLSRVLGTAVDGQRLSQWEATSQTEEPPVEEPSGPRSHYLGEFELLSVLGRGGMGTVYRAWQPLLGRQVALKCLHRPGDKAQARFTREIRALGRVRHPHLVTIFTSGSEGNQWFYAMELIEGATLAAVWGKLSAHHRAASGLDWNTWHHAVSTVCEEARRAEEPLSATEAGTTARHGIPVEAQSGTTAPSPEGRNYVGQIVELMRQVAEAAHALHEKGIVHRDIKPGNIMVTHDGGQSVLMDLGLALPADDAEGRLTRTRQFVGTPRYASPEQVLAVRKLDRRSDVYSLGATLWELLALRPLYGTTDDVATAELMERIQYQKPDPLRNHHPGIARDLEVIVEKCLAKNPNERYATAQELAEDLQRFLNKQPIKAQPPIQPWRRALHLIRHKSRLGLGLVVAGTFLCAALTIAFWLHHKLGTNPEDGNFTDEGAQSPPTSDNSGRRQPFKQGAVKEVIEPYLWEGVLEVPYVLWGGDVATIHANGGLETMPGSLFEGQGLELRLTPGDNFPEQVRRYLNGTSPFLRCTLSMMGQVSDILYMDPKARPVVFLQLTWSAGDHLVSRSKCQTLKDLEGKKIALQKGGPHVGMLGDILRTARLAWQDIQVVWTGDVTGDNGPAALFRKDASIDACFAITPDMLGLCGGPDKTGTGKDNTVKDAHVLVSTTHMKRSIADVYACRKDFYDAHKDVVEKFAAAYLKGCEELVNLRKGEAGGEADAVAKHRALMRLAQEIYGKDALPTEQDVEGLVLDAVFVGLPGNQSFFTDKGNLSGFEGKQKTALDLAVALGDAKERHEFLKADLDYDKLKQLGGLTGKAPPQSRFREDIKVLPENTIYVFTIGFGADQPEFDEEKYGRDFQEALEQASLFGNAVMVVRGHADPAKLLQDFVKAGMNKGLLKREGVVGDYRFYWNGEKLDLSDTKRVIDLIEKTDFGDAGVDPRLTLKILQKLSKDRAEEVRTAVEMHAKLRGIRFDPSQTKAIGVGVREPIVPQPRNTEEMARNRRVEFRLVKIQQEGVGADFEY